MSRNEESETSFIDDFEVITESVGNSLSETTSSMAESETAKMQESSSSSEMSSAQAPTPMPRSKNKVFPGDIHSKREVQWANEKEKLLCEIQDLKASSKQKEEEWLELSKSHDEAVNALQEENQKLRSNCKELQSHVDELAAKNETDVLALAELRDKSDRAQLDVQKRVEELERELEKRLVECDEACKTIDQLQAEKTENQTSLTKLNERLIVEEKQRQISVERLNAFESEKEHYKTSIQQFEHGLDNERKSCELAVAKIKELEAINESLREDVRKSTESCEKLEELRKRSEEALRETEEKMLESTAKLQTAEREKIQAQELIEEKTGNVKQLESLNEDLQKENKKLSEKASETQDQKDALESQLVDLKMGQTRWNTQKEFLEKATATNAQEMQNLERKIAELSEERDFYSGKCKDLDEAIKTKSDEIQQLSKESEELGKEIDILRARNEQLLDDTGMLKSMKAEHESEIRELNNNLVRVTEEMKKSQSQGEPGGLQQSQREENKIQVAVTRHHKEDEQWYESQEGEALSAIMFGRLGEMFSYDCVNITRNKVTMDLKVSIETEDKKLVEIQFPRRFPRSPMTAKCEGKFNSEVNIPYNSSKPMEEFAANFIQAFTQLIFAS